METSYDVQVRYEIFIPILFIAALIGCHMALRSAKIRDDEKLWVLVEYIWLLGAVLGLVSAASELRRINLQRDAQIERTTLTNEWNQLRVSARHSLEPWAQVGPCPSVIRDSAEDCRKVRAWFEYAASALELGADTQKWRTFLFQNADVDPVEQAKLPGDSQIPQLPSWDFEPLPKSVSPDALNFAHELLAGMHKLNELSEKTHTLESRATIHWYDTLLRSVVPWFLTIALALRITKNSVQYLKLKEQNAKTSKLRSAPQGLLPELPEDLNAVQFSHAPESDGDERLTRLRRHATEKG